MNKTRFALLKHCIERGYSANKFKKTKWFNT